jgi:hypothetical protein
MSKKLFILPVIIFGIGSFLNAQLSPQAAVPLMQKGINMGNTLEPPNEGDWGNPPVQEFHFDTYNNAGFNVVRIPVTWDKHTSGSSPYAIDANWLQRVETIVDWGLSKGLFIVLNAHHEDWIKKNYGNALYRARFDSIWSQISVRFRNKSDKLFFEILNEPVVITTAENNELHARILSIIRKTNPTRIVLFQGPDWGSSDGLINTAFPNDSFLMGSFHSYDPYTFGLLGQGTWGSSSDFATLEDKFITVKNWSIAHHIQVFLGEFGSLGSCDYNSRMKHYNAYVDLAQKYGFVYCAWEDGGDFKLLDRNTGKWDEIKDILVHSSLNSPKNPVLSLVSDTIIQFKWTNIRADYDSLFVERRTESGDYMKVATLKGSSIQFADTNLTQNTFYHYRVIAHYNSGENLYSHPQRIFLPIYVIKTRLPYLGTPANVPGTIEAENFDYGGEGLAYHDADPANSGGAYRPGEGVDIFNVNGNGFEIGNVYPGEWLEYTINVEQEADYRIDNYLSAVQTGGTFKISVGNTESGILTAESSDSWLKTKSVSTSMHLTAGEQILKFSIVSLPIFNIDKMEFNVVTSVQNIKNDNLFFSILQKPGREVTAVIADEFTVNFLQVYNSSGLLIQTIQQPAHYQNINTSRMPSGIYLINAIGKDQKFSRKIFLN